jgi:hypothetical protein
MNVEKHLEFVAIEMIFALIFVEVFVAYPSHVLMAI